VEIKKVLSIASVISALHFVEDLILFTIGRYTEVTLPVVIIGVVGLSLILALLSRNQKIKKFIGS
tara:strand:- start:181 stop:375 length:195 start_codon:yes stop_codon:yes gene_type:complete